MQKFISQKELYSNVKSISDEVQEGTTFIVLKYSKPAYQISPLKKNEYAELQKTLNQALFGVEYKKTKNSSKKQNKIQNLFEEFSDLKFSDNKNLSQNIDNILYK